MTMTFRHKHVNTDTVCNGNGMIMRVVGHTNDTKRGWVFNTNHDTKGKGWGG